MSSATTASPAPTASKKRRPARRRRAKKRMLVVVNPHATTVSDRLKNLVVYALQGRYDVEAVATEAQNHATEIGREAIGGGFDVVVCFGGDGTLNEIANGLAGTDIPVGLLPGGSANVISRTLGVPSDVVDATEHLLGLADDFHPRRIDLGTANGRRFLFACGAGLDASTAKRVDARPALKSRGGPWFYASMAISSFYGDYLRDPVRLRLEADGTEAEGVTAIAQNSDPYTYFGGRAIHICEGAAIDNGTLSIAVLRRAAGRDLPAIAGRLLHPRLNAPGHRQIDHVAGVTEARLTATSRDPSGAIRPFPVQVDGDYIGDHGELDLGIEPGALSVLV